MKIELIFFASLIAVASCGNSEEVIGTDESAAAAKSAVQDGSPIIKETTKGVLQISPAPKTIEPNDDRESQIKTLTMDGSSEAAFEASLQKFQETAPTKEYQKLKSAIQYLQVYDLSARGNKAKLYSNLDGKTAEEIIAMTGR